MQKSIVIKALAAGGQVSAAAIDMTAVVGEGIARHGLSPVASAAFGRALMACAYLCSWLKEDGEAVSLTLAGGGAGGKICAVGDGALRMRGFVENGQADLPLRADGKLDVGGFVGKRGTLTVVRDGGTGIPFVGTSELISGEIAEDLSAYFLTSEQRPTAVALGVRIGKDGGCLGAGGLFLQPLPGADEAAVSFCEREIARFSDISARVAEQGAEGVLKTVAQEPFSSRPIEYRCHCSRERAERAVLSLGRREAESVLAEQGCVSVQCHYCNTDYRFTREEILRLFGEAHG